MNGRFITDADIVRDQEDWGVTGWVSRPSFTGSTSMCVMDVHLQPGGGHAFHRHPCMEELIYCLDGRAEQWVGREKRILKAGDVAHVPMNEVHGTYNVFDAPVTFLAVLSPAKFDGPALIDVSQEEPWKSLRTRAR